MAIGSERLPDQSRLLGGYPRSALDALYSSSRFLPKLKTSVSDFYFNIFKDGAKGSIFSPHSSFILYAQDNARVLLSAEQESCQVQDEESLVRRAQEHDTEAFAELYEKHFAEVYRYVALRIGIRMEAEDVTQQVFVNAFQAISSYKWRGLPFAAWLFRIARNLIIDRSRKLAREPVLPLDEVRAQSSDDPVLSVEQKLSIEQLNVATKRLTTAQREVIALRFAGGLSTAEVAKAMGRSEGAVKALQHSALVALRKILLPEQM